MFRWFLLAGFVFTNAAFAQISLVNVSARARVSSGEGVLIAGFVIKNGTHRMLIRAVGPTLSGFGVNTPLADPVLSVHRTQDGVSTPIASSDDWDASSDVATWAVRSGAFVLPRGSRDAALAVTLEAGQYTAVASAKDSAVGITLIEVYDLDPTVDGLVNLSVRGITAPGEAVLMPGFVLLGGGSRLMLFREIGPTLRTFGVPNALGDPKISLYQIVPNNTFPVLKDVVGTGIMTDDYMVANFAAFRLGPNPQDSAFSFNFTNNLSPTGKGSDTNFSIVADSVSGSTGVVLVELYAR